MPRPINVTTPARAVDVLKWLAGLSDHDISVILASLTGGDSVGTRAGLVARVKDALPAEAPSAHAEALVTEIFSLLLLCFSHQWDLEDLAKNVAHDPRLDLGDEEQETLAARLRTIALNPTVVLLAKALDVMGEHQYLLHESRITSDIRPIYDGALPVTIIGAVLTHILKLEYHALSGREEIYLALSDQDLEELGEAVDRAKQESRALGAFIKSADLKDLSLSME